MMVLRASGLGCVGMGGECCVHIQWKSVGGGKMNIINEKN